MSQTALHPTPIRSLFQQYRQVRQLTEQIIKPLSAEDCMVQSMDDVSPTRWHIAHTTWFFETFVLKHQPRYVEHDPQFNYLFNSYYNSIGKQFPRPQRGFISRPGLQQIKQYRNYVDEQMTRLLESGGYTDEIRQTIEVGLHHEQQHQELMLTDIKHVLSCNPTMPEYTSANFDEHQFVSPDWMHVDEGLYSVGSTGDEFSFDNESPQHRVFLNDFCLANNLVTCGQYIEFIESGGYERPEYWLSLGWSAVNTNGWDAPMYWVKKDGDWFQFTLSGLQPVNVNWPVCHVSYFEADAFARWSGDRLPTEFEWEVASQMYSRSDKTIENQFADVLIKSGRTVHPTRASSGLTGGVWQWTISSYSAYPGYQPPAGAIGEYNGKFMCNQYVLRGGSIATSSDHIRPTYRNFFPPDARWQFFGIRLAK